MALEVDCRKLVSSLAAADAGGVRGVGGGRAGHVAGGASGGDLERAGGEGGGRGRNGHGGGEDNGRDWANVQNSIMEQLMGRVRGARS